MFGKSLEGKRIAALAADGFEQVELTAPVRAFHKAGAQVRVVSLHPGSIRGVNGLAKGKKIDVDETVGTADPAEYDALLVPGGLMNPDLLRQSVRARRFIREFDESRKPIAVLCHGPWLLVSAGLVKGRRLTSWPGIADDVRNAGGDWEDAEVVRDGNWVSSRGPQDLRAFTKAAIAMFEEHASRSVPIERRARWPRALLAGAALAASALAVRQAVAAAR